MEQLQYIHYDLFYLHIYYLYRHLPRQTSTSPPTHPPLRLSSLKIAEILPTSTQQDRSNNSSNPHRRQRTCQTRSTTRESNCGTRAH
jgi:hypothetical protein